MSEQRTFKVKEPKKIEDGVHFGKIIGVEYRDQPYEYTDLVIEFENGCRIKAGFPSMITPVNKLGKAMILFGATIEIGKELNPASTFVSKECQFMTMTENGFARIVPGSLKPK